MTEQVQRIVSQMAQAEGVTEELKAQDPLKWMGLMNNLLHSGGGDGTRRTGVQLSLFDVPLPERRRTKEYSHVSGAKQLAFLCHSK